MAKKRLFNEDIAYSQILRISENSKKNIEAERDERIASNPEKEEEISVEYRNKLQSIYRIRNNAFALMLRQGFECYAVKSKNGEENNIFVILPLKIWINWVFLKFLIRWKSTMQ